MIYKLLSAFATLAFAYFLLTGRADAVCTDPGVMNVRASTAYIIDDVPFVGTLDLPAASVVESTIVFDNGTQTGTLLSTDPGIANVLIPTSYFINSTSFTGIKKAVTNVMKRVILKKDSTDPSDTVITISQGDTPTFQFLAQNGQQRNIDLTGAAFTTSIIGELGDLVTIPDAQHTANADQVGHRGEYTMDVTAVQSSSMVIGENKEIVTRVVQGSSIVFLHGVNILTVLPNVPIQ